MRGFVKLKKIQKSEKNSEVGGWVKPQLGILFFLILCFFVLFFVVLHVSKKKKILGKGVGGYDLANPSFSRIFGLFLA